MRLGFVDFFQFVLILSILFNEALIFSFLKFFKIKFLHFNKTNICGFLHFFLYS